MALESLGVKVFVMGMGEFRRDLGTVRQDLQTTAAAANTLGAGGGTLASQLTVLSNGLIATGRALTLGLTLPLLAATGVLVDAGADFEDGFQKIAKTMNGAATGFDDIAKAAKEKLGITITTMDQARDAADKLGMKFGEMTPIGEKLREQFRNMALEVPIATDKLLALGEELAMLGVQTDDIVLMTELMAKLASVTDISAETAANGIVHLRNVANEGNLSMVEFARSAGSALVALSNDSASTGNQILNLAERIAAAGSAAKLTGPEILAWATTLGDVGSKAESGGTAISRMFTNMLIAVSTGSEELKTFASVTGQTIKEFSAAFEKDGSAAMLNFIGDLRQLVIEGKITKEMLADMGLAGVRAFDIIGRLGEATDLYSKNLSVANKAWMEQIALEEAAEKRFNSLKTQIQLLKNAFTDLGIEIFDLVKGDLKALIQSVIGVIKWFKDLDPNIQKFIIKLGLMAAALGPVLAFLGLAIKAGLAIAAVFTSTSPVVLALAAAFLALGAAMILPDLPGLFGGSPTTAAPIPVGGDGVQGRDDRQQAVGGGIALTPTIFQPTQQALTRLMATVSETVLGIKQSLTEMSEGFMKAFQPFIDETGPKLKTIFDNVALAIDKLKPLADAVVNLLGLNEIDWNKLGEGLGGLAGLVLTDVTDFFVSLSEDLPGAIDSLTTFVQETGPGIVGTFDAMRESIAAFFEKWLPVQESFLAMDFANLEEAFGRLGETFSTLEGPLGRLGEAFGPILEALGVALVAALLVAVLFINLLVLAFTNLINGLSIGAAALPLFLDSLALIGQGIQDVFTGAVAMVTGFVDLLLAIPTFWAEVFSGVPVADALANLGATIASGTSNILLGFINWSDGILQIVTGATGGIIAAFLFAFGTIAGYAAGFAGDIISIFEDLAQTLVGGSIVPDMMAGIIASFTELTQIPGIVAGMSAAVQGTLTALGGAFKQLAATVRAAMAAAVAAMQSLIGAAAGVLAAVTSSPTLTIQHPFELFEDFMKETKIPDLLANMIPSSLTSGSAAQAILPATAGSATSIDNSLNIGDISGVPMQDENSFADMLLKTTRQMSAIGH